MLRDVRRMLNQIEKFLDRKDQASADLAHILSALRGPDSDIDSVKESTTCLIRKAAFPNITPSDSYKDLGELHTMSGGWLVANKVPTDTKLLEINQRADESSHFNAHIRLAAEALTRVDRS